MREAIIFDLDDTLYDAWDFYRGAFREAAQYLAGAYERDAEALFDALSNEWQNVNIAKRKTCAACG